MLFMPVSAVKLGPILWSLLAASIPTLDFTALIASAFEYANGLLPVLGPIAGLGIGFTLSLGAIAWIGNLLKGVFKAKGR